MPKTYIKDRVKFLDKNEQREFMQLLKIRIGNTKKIAMLSKVGLRQISEWSNAKSTLSLYAFEKLILVSGVSRPNKIEIINRYAHTSSAGKKGFFSVKEKYGGIPRDEEDRKKAWKEWWNKIGKNKEQKILQRKLILIPKHSIELAELFGILIGDGGVTKSQVRITLNGVDDKDYIKFVVKLLQKIFKVKPKIYKFKNSKAVDICISRTDLILYLVEQGIKLGHKINQQLSIPRWILEEEKYFIPCIRGMFDTDGCIVRETHTIKQKKYLYYRLNFTSASPLLVKQIIQILEILGFHPKLRRGGRSVQLENITEIWEYLRRVGTHNPKHLIRLRRSRIVGLVHSS